MKKKLLELMEALDFPGIVDLKVEGGKEYVGHRMNDSDEIAWLPIENEGSGFKRLFGGFKKYIPEEQDR